MNIEFEKLQSVCIRRNFSLSACMHQLSRGIGLQCKEANCPLKASKKQDSLVLELDKKDLLALVKGTAPDYSVMDELKAKGYGEFREHYAGEWYWFYPKLKKCTEEELLEIYRMCKESWK